MAHLVNSDNRSQPKGIEQEWQSHRHANQSFDQDPFSLFIVQSISNVHFKSWNVLWITEGKVSYI